MTVLGLNAGLLAFPQGSVFSVQGNVFKIVEKTNQGIQNGWTVPVGMKMQGGGSVTVSNAMPFGGKVLRLVIRRHVPNNFPNATSNFTVRKNNIDTALTLSFSGSSENNTTKTIDSDVEFNAGDLIGIRFTGSSNLDSESRHTMGVVYAFNIGETTP